MSDFLEYILFFVPLLSTVVVVVAFLLGMNQLLLVRHPEIGNERRLPRQLVLLGLTLAGVVVIALALPVNDTTRNQVITLIGVLTSGVVAFSSTTVIANLMAGIMLRVNRPFRTGDFIRVGDHFGRVSERGLLDTEIQSEQRELISLPNIYLINNPVVVVSSSGAIISATLSLSYDVHHSDIESLLISAARETSLDDPFVQITKLNDFSVSYRVSGLLKDVKSLLTTQSNLYRSILDMFHVNSIEIVSPAFMNQRQLDDKPVIPRSGSGPRIRVDESATAEEIVFDKAELAEQKSLARKRLKDDIQMLEIEAKSTQGDDKIRVNQIIEGKHKQLKNLGQSAE